MPVYSSKEIVKKINNKSLAIIDRLEGQMCKFFQVRNDTTGTVVYETFDEVFDKLDDFSFFGSDHSSFVVVRKNVLTDDIVIRNMDINNDGASAIVFELERFDIIILDHFMYESLISELGFDILLLTGHLVDDVSLHDIAEPEFLNDGLMDDFTTALGNIGDFFTTIVDVLGYFDIEY